jgi:hypothetical protein
MEKERKEKDECAEDKRAEYSKPKLKKHENLKEITLLSFTPPGR